jgi:hypothetical protein
MTRPPPRRGLTIRSEAIPEAAGVPTLEPLKLEREEGVNQLFEYRLVLQTPEGFALQLDITHTASRVTLTADEEVVFNGGGSHTTWASGRIHSATTGPWVSHAAAHRRRPAPPRAKRKPRATNALEPRKKKEPP